MTNFTSQQQAHSTTLMLGRPHCLRVVLVGYGIDFLKVWSH